MRKILLSCLLILLLTISPSAFLGDLARGGESGIKLALILSPGGRGDLGWNDLAWRGAEIAKEKGFVKDYSLLVSSSSEILSLLMNLAGSGAYDLILSNGWGYVESLGNVANQYPDQSFAQMDTRPKLGPGDPGNVAVLGLIFNQEQMSALAGALAAFVAIHHDAPHIGLVLGREGSILHDFEVGYKWGADWGLKWLEQNRPGLLTGKKFLKTPKTERVLWTYVGTFDDPAKGKAATTIQLDQGAGIVYQVAGGTGLGVLSAVADYHKERGIEFTDPPLAIGVDADQDWINPHIIASGMKRVDMAALEACRLVYAGTFREFVKNNQGTLMMNLNNNGVALSDEKILQEFLDFGLKTGGIDAKKVPQIVADYHKLRASHPDWFWKAIKELENLIKDSKVEIPKPSADPVKYDIRKLRNMYG
jgi:basic membrane protein A